MKPLEQTHSPFSHSPWLLQSATSHSLCLNSIVIAVFPFTLIMFIQCYCSLPPHTHNIYTVLLQSPTSHSLSQNSVIAVSHITLIMPEQYSYCILPLHTHNVYTVLLQSSLHTHYVKTKTVLLQSPISHLLCL